MSGVVWLVFYDQSPADYVLEHVASEEGLAHFWVDEQPMLEQNSLIVVSRDLDDPSPIRFP